MNDPKTTARFLKHIDEYFEEMEMPMMSEDERIPEHIFDLPINEKLTVALHIIMHAHAEFIEKYHDAAIYEDEVWEDFNDGISSFQTAETQIYNLNGTYVKYLSQTKHDKPEEV